MKLKEYLRSLYIFRSYLIKYQWNLSSWLRNDVSLLIGSIDKEIETYKNLIINYKKKNENLQLTIFDFDRS